MRWLAHSAVVSAMSIMSAQPAVAQVQMGGSGTVTLADVAYDFDIQICGEQVPGAYMLNGTGETAEGQLFVVMVMRNELQEGRVEESVTLNNPQANGAVYFKPDDGGWMRCPTLARSCKPGEGISVEGPLLEIDGASIEANGVFVGPTTGEEGQPGTLTATCGEDEPIPEAEPLPEDGPGR